MKETCCCMFLCVPLVKAACCYVTDLRIGVMLLHFWFCIFHWIQFGIEGGESELSLSTVSQPEKQQRLES